MIGRAYEPEPPAEKQAQARPAEKKPEVKKPSEKPAPEAAAKPAPAKVVTREKIASMGMGGGLPAPKKQADATPPPPPPPANVQTAPQSTPAKPKPSDEEKPKGTTSPYKLDLSFGGFGLGIGLFDTPISVAVDDLENIYVLDQGNYRVQKFDRFGIFQFAFGRQGMGDGEFQEQNVPSVGRALRMTGEFEFNKPVGMLLDHDDIRNLVRIHVVDSLNNRIQRFLLLQSLGQSFPDNGPTNVFIMLTKTGDVPDTPPISNSLEEKYKKENRQVILDPVYLSDTPGKANPLLLAPFIWGGLGYTQGLLNLPTYLAKDDTNNILYVSDTVNGRIQGFNLNTASPATDATFYREWGNDMNLPFGAGRLKEPTAIAFDNMGFGGFLVLDHLADGSYNIQKFDRDGRFVGVFAASGDKAGQFKQPVSMAINTFDNTVFITDRARKKVMVYNNKGDFMYEFGGDELTDPRGIAVLRNNYVYVTDAAKNMVFKYVPR